MTHAATLLVENLPLIAAFREPITVLDLACGQGRNGLYLAKHGIPVVFADRNEEALDSVNLALSKNGWPGSTWQVDLEEEGSSPLADKAFDAVMVFNYLHRPLLTSLGQSVKDGGLVIYETFTIANKKFGRPNRNDFLLQEKELLSYFSGWEVLHYFEGELSQPDRAVAQIIARKK